MTDTDQPLVIGLVGLDVGSAVNMDGAAFCQVQATGEDGTLFRGQLSCAEVRIMALGWLAAAEAAEQDSLVYQLLTSEVDLDPPIAAGFIAQLRTMRNQETMPI